jgi:hypothetical protein
MGRQSEAELTRAVRRAAYPVWLRTAQLLGLAAVVRSLRNGGQPRVMAGAGVLVAAGCSWLGLIRERRAWRKATEGRS